jgi:hypothetical protein
MCTQQGFFPSSDDMELQQYARVYSDIIGVSTKVLATYFVAAVMNRKTNMSRGFIRMLVQMNSQTATLTLINGYGVVIPVPIERKKDLPNFVDLMNPSRGWCGSCYVCRDQNEEKVFSNVLKIIQLIVWTCMHPWNQTNDPTEETRLPFRFWWDNAEYKKFFGKAQKDLKSWDSIELVSDAETTPCPLFKAIGSERPLSLYGLVKAILRRDTDGDGVSAAWTRWDEKLLSKFPRNGIGTLWSDPIKSSRTLTNPEAPTYNKLMLEMRYQVDEKMNVIVPGDSLDKVTVKNVNKRKSPR